MSKQTISRLLHCILHHFIGARKRLKTSPFEDINECLIIWYRQMQAKMVPVDGPVLRTKALEFADALGVKDFNETNGESMLQNIRVSLMSANLPACHPAACHPVCHPACHPVCHPACHPVYHPVCLQPCLPTCHPASLPTCLPPYLPPCLPPCLPTCLPTCLPPYLPPCLPPFYYSCFYTQDCCHLLKGIYTD